MRHEHFFGTPDDRAEPAHQVFDLAFGYGGLFVSAEDIVEFLVIVGNVHLVEVVVRLGGFGRLRVEVLGVDGVVAV